MTCICGKVTTGARYCCKRGWYRGNRDRILKSKRKPKVNVVCHRTHRMSKWAVGRMGWERSCSRCGVFQVGGDMSLVMRKCYGHQKTQVQRKETED